MKLEDMKKLSKEQQKNLFEEIHAARKVGKSVNYASVYNAGPPTIARSAGVSEEEGVKLHKAYWDLNWSVKAIAEEQCVIEDNQGNKWLVNPVNGFCYSLRKDSDRFSTLAQGTGSYIFDLWVDNVLEEMYKRHGVKRLSGSFHDEQVIVIADNFKAKESIEDIVRGAIQKVNKDLHLRRKMDCDVQFGQRYAEIH